MPNNIEGTDSIGRGWLHPPCPNLSHTVNIDTKGNNRDSKVAPSVEGFIRTYVKGEESAFLKLYVPR